MSLHYVVTYLSSRADWYVFTICCDISSRADWYVFTFKFLRKRQSVAIIPAASEQQVRFDLLHA
jgi:hypothetical protein